MKRPLEGWLLTGWQAHPEGVTDVSVGHYDIPGAWHVHVKRNDRGEPVIHMPAHRVENEGRNVYPEPSTSRSAEIHEYVLTRAVAGHINIFKWEVRHGSKKVEASGAGDREAAQPGPGATGPGAVRGTEPGL